MLVIRCLLTNVACTVSKPCVDIEATCAPASWNKGAAFESIDAYKHVVTMMVIDQDWLMHFCELQILNQWMCKPHTSEEEVTWFRDQLGLWSQAGVAC
jgi:hypothetical protein